MPDLPEARDALGGGAVSPSTTQAATEAEPLPEWRDRIAARIGEDPGRWLDRDLVEPGPSHTDRTWQRAVHGRIKGIRDRDVISAWQAVEVRLDRAECPRQQVMGWLNQRDDDLKGHENPRRAPVATTADEDSDAPAPRIHAACGATVDPREGPGWWCPDCETVTRSVEVRA